MADNYTGTDWKTRTQISTDIMKEIDEGVEKNKEDIEKNTEDIEKNTDLIDSSNTVQRNTYTVTIADRSGSLYLSRVGNVCVMTSRLIIGIGTATQSSVKVDVTIPEAYYPRETITVSVFGVNSNVVQGNIRFNYNTSGALSFVTDYSTTAIEAYFSVAYIALN